MRGKNVTVIGLVKILIDVQDVTVHLSPLANKIFHISCTILCNGTTVKALSRPSFGR